MRDYTKTYYNQEWVYKEIKKYFGVHEFFRPSLVTWAQKKYPSSWENKLWSYLEYRNLSNLLYVRIKLNRRITINHGKLQQRGFRDNLCKMLLGKAARMKFYLSAHVRGAGVDFDVENMIAEDVRNWITNRSNDLPFNLRLEWKYNKTNKPITWVHMDSNYEPNHKRVYKFKI